MMRRTTAIVALLLLCASAAWATTTTKNLSLTGGFTVGQSGWGAAMNANLARIDSAGPVVAFPGEDLNAKIALLDSTHGGEIRLLPGTYNTLANPVLADTATRDATVFTSPLAGDQCFIGNYYGSNLGSYQVYDGTAWRRVW